MTKEEMLEKRIITFPSDDNQMTDEGIKRNVYAAMDEYAKQEAIEFFKWNAFKVDWYIKYIEKIRPLVTSNEIEEALNTFEGSTFEERYELYLKSKV